MRTNRTLLAALVAALVAVPLGIAAWNELALHRGRHVLVRVRPVDPIDPLRGEYVELTLAISSIHARGLGDAEVVYVPLRRRADGVWGATGAQDTRPDRGVFLRGRVRWSSGGRAFVDYGLDRAYIREGTSARYERAEADGRLFADVVVSDGGKAKLAKLVIR